jgi:hypothetical protein
MCAVGNVGTSTVTCIQVKKAIYKRVQDIKRISRPTDGTTSKMRLE